MGPFSNDPRAGVPTPGEASSGVSAWAAPNVGVLQPSGVATSGPKWPALRLIATVLKIVAWIEVVLGVISALVEGIALAALVGGGAFLLTLFLLVVVAIGFLFTYAASEGIMLFITIEKNTRKYE
jgi:hypothetical protein